MIYVLTPERNVLKENGIYQYIDSKQFILDQLEKSGQTIFGLDTETTGLDFIDHTMVMLQIGTEKDQFIIDTRYHDIDFLEPILSSTEITKVLQNAKFDYKFIKKFSGIELEKVYDTMLADKVLNCGKNMSSSMQSLALRYLNMNIQESKEETSVSFLHHKGPFTLKQIQYGANDVVIPLKLLEKIHPKIKAANLGRVLALENKACLAFGDIEYNGIRINKERWLERAEESRSELSRLKMNLDNFIETDESLFKFQDSAKQLDFFKDPDEISFVNVNWDSPKQVLKIFRESYPELESVSADTLLALEVKTDLVRTYMAYKKMSKLYNSYGPSFLDNVKSDGKIHTRFSQVLQTGRVSSSEPNMQQLPGDNSFRNCFITDNDNEVFVSSDYSSQELCVIATIAQDPVWVRALEEGKDLHSVCAALVFGIQWEQAAEEGCAFYGDTAPGEDYPMKKCKCPKHKELRTNVKSINFGLAYGMSEYRLSDKLGITVGEARELIEKYFTTFPKIREALKRFGDFGKRNGYIMTMPPFRRKRFFGDHKYISMDGSISGRIERASKNTPIQGSSADMTKVAMVYIREYIKSKNIPVRMVMTVHDQIDTIVENKDYAETWAEELEDLMEKAALKIITNGLLKAETEISPVWKK